MNKKTILIDMDGVITDYESLLLRKYRDKYPKAFYVPLEKRCGWNITQQYPRHLRKFLNEINQEEGFFIALEPLNGAVESIEKIARKGHEIFICTSPSSRNMFSAKEKIEWVKKHLGIEWVTKLILTHDKTLIWGDYLIDDKEVIEGNITPYWEHLLFNQPWNKLVKEKRRISWQTWENFF